MPVERAPERILELWKWYGLECLRRCSRRDWPWAKDNRRCNQLLSECVNVGDEALLLCILQCKLGAFLKAKQAIENGNYDAKKRGRKKGSTATATPEELGEAYNSFREEVKRVRECETNRSWDNQLREWAREAMGESAQRRSNYNNMEFEIG